MHIAFIVERYPTEKDPVYTFVRDLVAEICKQGIKCSVICPQSITREVIHRVPMRNTEWHDYVDSNHSITVYQPYYVSLSNRFSRVNDLLFQKAARTAYKRIAKTVDVLYCHFWKMGFVASSFESGKPIFVASGESRIELSKGNDDIKKLHKQLSGVIYVSTKNYLESCELGLQKNTEYIVAPNGVNGKVFHKQDKQICRKELSIPSDALIGIFVGAFNERKGVKRVDQASSGLNNVKMIYLGTGEYTPISNVLFSGSVPHEEIPKYMSAADFFILPTLAEGCCNAIVEALSCGLPVISSDLPFNSDILDSTCSVLINPEDIDSIRKAICKITNDNFRMELAKGALYKSKGLQLEVRANNILKFINDNMMVKNNEDRQC